MTREVLALRAADFLGFSSWQAKVYLNRFVEELTTQLGSGDPPDRVASIRARGALRRRRGFRRAQRCARVPQPRAQRGEACEGGQAARHVEKDGDDIVWAARIRDRASTELHGRLFELFAARQEGGTASACDL